MNEPPHIVEIVDGIEAEPKRLDELLDTSDVNASSAHASADEQLNDVRAALRVLDASDVPSVDYYSGAELSIAQRVTILAHWAGRGRRRR